MDEEAKKILAYCLTEYSELGATMDAAIGDAFTNHIFPINVSKDLSREGILELGRKGPYNRFATFPAQPLTVTFNLADLASVTFKDGSKMDFTVGVDPAKKDFDYSQLYVSPQTMADIKNWENEYKAEFTDKPEPEADEPTVVEEKKINFREFL